MKDFRYFLSKFLGRVTEDAAVCQKNKRSAKAWMCRGTICTAKLVRGEGRGRARRVRLRGAAMPPACAGAYVVVSFFPFNSRCRGRLRERGREEGREGKSHPWRCNFLGASRPGLPGRRQPDPAFPRRTGRRPRGASLALFHLAPGHWKGRAELPARLPLRSPGSDRPP